MKGIKLFLFNGAILALATVILRGVSVSFNAFVTKTLGEEAVGLFTLVMSVYTLAITFACSAVNLASVRLISGTMAKMEEYGADASEIKKELRRELWGCVKYSLFFSLLTSTVLFILSPLIGGVVLGDERTILSIRVLSLSLPAIAVASAVSGYFTAVRKAYKNAVISAIEQLVKIVLILIGLVVIAPHGIEYACVAVVGGGAIGEGCSLISSIIFYCTDKLKVNNINGHRRIYKEKRSALSRAAEIAFPVALGSYVRQSLVCAEHIAIPSSLKKSGADSASALASYGTVHGMVFPLIFYPASVMNAFSSLLVPEITACVATDNMEKARSIAQKVIKVCFIFSFAVSGVFLTFANEFGLSLYSSNEAGRYIAMIAPLIPVMYLDTSVDFILKGLGEQVYTMGVNILDATLSLSLVLILVPRMGITGYIVTVYLVELINCALSLARLIKVTRLTLKPGWIIRPFIAVYLSAAAVKFISSDIRLSFITTHTAFLAFFVSVCLLLFATKAVTKSDSDYLKSIVNSAKK